MNINKEMITDISGVNPRKCMKCGKCSATCPAFDAMDYHPHQFVDMVENGRMERKRSLRLVRFLIIRSIKGS